MAALCGTGEQLGRCATRHYWPLAILAALFSRRARGLLLAGAVLDGLLDHKRCGRPDGLPAHLLLRRLDDIAYGTGLWAGAVRRRTVAPLLPRLAGGAARSALGPVPGERQPGQPPGGTRG